MDQPTVNLWAKWRIRRCVSLLCQVQECYHIFRRSLSNSFFFTINGKAFPATEEIPVKKGERARLRLIGIGQFIHPMHLHGLPFRIIATDGHAVPEAAQLEAEALSGPGRPGLFRRD